VAGVVSKITPAGVVSTYASGALISKNDGLVFDASGNLYVSSLNLNTITKVTPGGAQSTFASGAPLNQPDGLAIDASGNVYVANFGGNNVIKITPGGAMSVFASGLSGPNFLALDSIGNLYVSNQFGASISKVTSGGVVSTFATGFTQSYGLAFDRFGDLYVADYGASDIKKVTPAGTVSTLVGIRGVGLVFDPAGNLYVARYNTDVTKIDGPVPITTQVTITPSVTGRAIDLGTHTAGTLGLTDAELDRIAAGTLGIGDSNSGAITVTAVISPASYKTLALGNNTSFASAGGFVADIGATAAVYEKITVTGTLAISSTATFSLAATGGYTPAAGASFTLITNDATDAISGTFSGWSEGTLLTNFLGASALNGTVTYLGGTNNDLVVSVVTKPTVTLNTAIINATATTLTITGTGFDAATPVNNIVVLSPVGTGTVTNATATSLTVSVSGLRAGALNAVVTNGNGTSGSAVQVATVRPVVTSNTATILSNVTTLTINGFGFSPTFGNNTVVFTPAGSTGSITGATATTLTVTSLTGLVPGNLSAIVTSNAVSSTPAVQVATVTSAAIAITPGSDAPPGTTPGSPIANATWESIRTGMVISGNGAIAYRGHLTGSSVTADNFQGIWKSPDGTVAATTLVARSGITVEPSVGALFDILPLNPVINNASQTSFVGFLRVNSGSPAVTTSTDSGVWSELGTGGLKKLIREGDTLSGSTVGTVAPSGGIAGSTNAAAFSIKLGTGSALVRVDVAGAVVTPSMVAKQGDTAPVKTGGDPGTFDALGGNTSDPRMDATGNVAFLSTVVPAGQGIWYKTVAGALTAVANSNQAAPGQGGPVFTGFERPSLSSDGTTIAFRAFLSGANSHSVFKGTPAAPVAIAKTNDTTITGVPAGRKLWSVWSPFTNTTGSVAFRVSLVDTATNANESRAILTDTNGTLTVIAKVGDTAPGLGAETFTNFDHPLIGDGNQCAFIASTSGGTVGLFRQAAGGGALSLVMAVGDVVNFTGGGSDTIAQMTLPGTATDDRKYETKAIDANGRLLVHATYSSGKTSIFLSSP